MRPLPAGQTARCEACPLPADSDESLLDGHRSSQAPPLGHPESSPVEQLEQRTVAKLQQAVLKDAASQHPPRVPRESGARSGAPVVPAAVRQDSSGRVLPACAHPKNCAASPRERARLAGAGRLPGVPRLASHPRSCRRSALARSLPRQKIFFEVPQIRRICPDGVRRRTTVPLKVRQPIRTSSSSASHAIIQYRQRCRHLPAAGQ